MQTGYSLKTGYSLNACDLQICMANFNKGKVNKGHNNQLLFIDEVRRQGEITPARVVHTDADRAAADNVVNGVDARVVAARRVRLVGATEEAHAGGGPHGLRGEDLAAAWGQGPPPPAWPLGVGRQHEPVERPPPWPRQ